MISVYFGKTESGKSYLAEMHSKKYDRVVLYDNAHCFKDGKIISDLSIINLEKVFREFCKKDKFRLIFRAPRTMNEKMGANRVASFVFALGSFYKDLEAKSGKSVSRFLFLVDEADKVSSMSKDSVFYRAVTKGRHFCFDSYGIAQGVKKLPNYWRENASEFNFFRIPENDETKSTLGKKASSKLSTLGQYEYLRTTDSSHEVEHVSKDQKVINRIAID